MKQGTDILTKIGKEPGFKVPEGYFADFTKKMDEMLPAKEFKEEPRPGVWLRIRPWIYMAAMFAGVWCMMTLFSDMKNANSRNLGINPEIADAMSDEKFVDDYMMFGDISDYDIMQELYNEGVDAGVFNADSLKSPLDTIID